MKAYIAVFNNPYFQVTGKDGSFTLKNVPPGTYTRNRLARTLWLERPERHHRTQGIQGRHLHVQGHRGIDLAEGVPHLRAEPKLAHN